MSREKSFFGAEEKFFSESPVARMPPEESNSSRKTAATGGIGNGHAGVSFGILEEREDVNPIQLGASAQELELDDERRADDVGPQFAGQARA